MCFCFGLRTEDQRNVKVGSKFAVVFTAPHLSVNDRQCCTLFTMGMTSQLKVFNSLSLADCVVETTQLWQMLPILAHLCTVH